MRIASLDVTASGTLPGPTALTGIEIFRDVDESGTHTPADEALSQSLVFPADDGILTIPLDGGLNLASKPELGTLRLEVTASLAVEASFLRPSAPASASGLFPIQSTWHTITAAQPQTFAAWAATVFSPAQLGDSSISGPSADYDGDGLNTFGGNPLIPDRHLTIAVAEMVREIEASYLEHLYTRRTPPPDLNYRPGVHRAQRVAASARQPDRNPRNASHQDGRETRTGCGCACCPKSPRGRGASCASRRRRHRDSGPFCICRDLGPRPNWGPMEKRMPKIVRFASRVLRDFFLRNHGLLLTAAVSHNMMLSLIPLSAVLMVVFSHFIPEPLLMETITTEISFIAPGFAPTLTEVLEGFLRSREWIGWLGLGSLFLFSSLAFRVLEDAIAVIFQRPLIPLKRKFWVSALMPYFFILVVAVGLIGITAVNAIIDAQDQKNFTFLNLDVLLHKHINHIIYLTGLLGLVLLFTLFYKIMPVVKVSFRRALAGGLTATILWELVRHLLVSYYTKVSIVNVVYGSMATIVIVLLIMEAIALILLLGAQVIADLQRSADAGLAWHEDPDSTPPVPEPLITHEP